MDRFEFGDRVWWFFGDERRVVYPNWIELLSGYVVWNKPDEEVIHVYREGHQEIWVILDSDGYSFRTKQEAIDAMISRLKEI